MDSMAPNVTLDTVDEHSDIDQLWRAFLDAKSANDDTLADAIRQRMAVLQRFQQLEGLDDDQLQAKISNLRKKGEAPAHSEVGDAPDVSHLGDGQSGPSTELILLQEEAERRGMTV